jgi:hypothetical protein
MDRRFYFRIRFKVQGGHVHCRVFSTPNPNGTWAKLGDLTVSRGPEFRDLCAAFRGADMLGEDENQDLVEALKP